LEFFSLEITELEFPRFSGQEKKKGTDLFIDSEKGAEKGTNGNKWKYGDTSPIS